MHIILYSDDLIIHQKVNFVSIHKKPLQFGGGGEIIKKNPYALFFCSLGETKKLKKKEKLFVSQLFIKIDIFIFHETMIK